MTPKIKASKDLHNKMWASLNRYNYIKYIRTSRYKHLSIVDRFFYQDLSRENLRGSRNLFLLVWTAQLSEACRSLTSFWKTES